MTMGIPAMDEACCAMRCLPFGVLAGDGGIERLADRLAVEIMREVILTS